MRPSKKGMASKLSRRTSVAPKPTTRSQLVDLFQPFGIPPTPLHEVVQNVAIEAGWIPPWDSSALKEKSQIARNQIAYRQPEQGLLRVNIVIRLSRLVLVFTG
jgi:hypothetical protein